MDGLYNKERRALEDQYLIHKENWTQLYPNGMILEDGSKIPLDQILQKCVYEGLKSDIEKLQNVHGKNGGRSHHWIGINPPPEQYTLGTLYEAMVEAIGKYSWIEDGSYMYTLEQNTSGGIRPHIHFFLVSNTKPYRIIDLLAKHFKIGKPSIDLKTYRKNILWKEHIAYISGDKKEEKMENVEQDNIDKESVSVPKFVGSII